MENLAYLHVASVYEDLPSSEIVSLSRLFKQAAAPDWKRLSGKAWKYMLPLALTLSVLGAVSSAIALEKGDNGPSVRTLQQNLKRAGFYQAPITQVYDVSTEQAVRRFQKAADLEVNGVAGPVTIQKLEGWSIGAENAQASRVKKPTTRNSQVKKPLAGNSQAKKTTPTASVSTTRRDSDLLQRGDEGESIRILQERLRIAGYYYGNSTGVFGPLTEEAVKRFQEAYKLDVDGIVGPATLAKLPPLNIGTGEADDAPKPRVSGDKLRLGDRGEAVRVLQEQLIEAGYLHGEPNGYFGPYTADAVKKFQADNYLAASGVAGPTTRARLHDRVSATSKSDFNVMEIQRRLRERGFYKGELNGVMEDETKQAIKQAQQFYGVSLSDVRSGRF